MKIYKLVQYIQITTCLLSSVSCYHNDKDENISKDIVEINLDDIETIEDIKCSSFLSMPRTIILENNKDALIERIYGLDIYENNIYILDDKLNRLLVFDINGKYKYRIAKTGIGPGEHLDLSDFSIDRDNGLIYLLDEGNKCILEYNLRTLEFIKKIDIKNINGQNYCIQYLDGYLYINQTGVEETSSKYLLSIFNARTGKPINETLDSDIFNNGWNIPLRNSHSLFYSKNSKAPMFLEMFSNKIVTLNDGEYYTSYIINSKDFISDKDINEMKSEYYKTKLINLIPLFNSNKIYQISNILDMNRNLYIQYRQGMKILHLLYGKECKKSNKSERISNDLISKSKPLINPNFIYSDSTGLISVIKTEELSYFIEEVIDKGNLNQNIDNYEGLMKVDYDSNPILFYYEYN